jgi:hypothetical protein
MHEFFIDFALGMLWLLTTINIIQEEKAQARKIVLKLNFIRVKHAEVVHISQDLMAESDTNFCVFHCFCMLLRLTQNSTELKL